jgi:hypothetical protein
LRKPFLLIRAQNLLDWEVVVNAGALDTDVFRQLADAQVRGNRGFTRLNAPRS